MISALKASEGEASRSWGNRYRCGTVFEKVNAWLRAHGVEGNKAIQLYERKRALSWRPVTASLQRRSFSGMSILR